MAGKMLPKFVWNVIDKTPIFLISKSSRGYYYFSIYYNSLVSLYIFQQNLKLIPFFQISPYTPTIICKQVFISSENIDLYYVFLYI